MEFRRIMCAVDFSEGSRYALHVAAELARKSQAVLAIVHVVEPATWMEAAGIEVPPELDQRAHHRAETTLAEWSAEARRRGASEVTTRVASGASWEQIVAAAAEDPRIELIVMGTHGRTGVQRDLIGSVAERVIRQAPCSVLVARPRPDQT